MPRRAPNHARRSARLLTTWGAIGGLIALLGAWLSFREPRLSLQSPFGGGDVLVVAGLVLALACGLVALLRFLIGLIRKLDGERRPVRVTGSKGRP